VVRPPADQSKGFKNCRFGGRYTKPLYTYLRFESNPTLSRSYLQQVSYATLVSLKLRVIKIAVDDNMCYGTEADT